MTPCHVCPLSNFGGEVYRDLFLVLKRETFARLRDKIMSGENVRTFFSFSLSSGEKNHLPFFCKSSILQN